MVSRPFEILHTEDDMKRLISLLQTGEDETRVVIEATGIYHLPVLASLLKADMFVSVINPLVMKKYVSATIRKGKTDRLDAIRIANYGIEKWHQLERYVAFGHIYDELKILGRQYSEYVSMSIAARLTLMNLLDRTMPGIKTMFGGKRSGEPSKDKLCDFVIRYWHYDTILKMGEAGFVKSYSIWATKKGYRASDMKAKAIYSMAKDSIPTLPSGTPSTKMLVLEAARVLQELNKTLEVILAQMQALSRTLPEYCVVRAMSGVGDVLAPRLIAEIGDVRRFHCGSALVAYSGIDSPPFQSGNFTGTRRSISKRGSSLLRKTGYEVMKSLKCTKPINDDAVYRYILKKEAEGKAKKVAKIAGLNKFLRIYYARVSEIYA
jgi:transposase